METVQNFIASNKERFLNELMELLRIPSISADSAYAGDVRKMAEALEKSLTSIGVDNVKIFETPGHPIVYGEKIVDENLPTVLVYGHYDVQPPDPLELWDSPPFEPVIKNEKIYARGACDDKGQMYMHVKAVEAMLAENALACNVKFLIEGEEEVGSVNLENFCVEQKSLLECDVILISDTSIIANDTPSVTVGLRGLSYIEVEVTGASKDLHSGTFGGAVANPINELSKMIASLKDENNSITIPGFYDDVIVLTESERAALNEAPFDLDAYKNELKIEDVEGEKGYTTIERASIRPTLDVNGMWGGYIGEGAKTVLPSKAFAKISMRLVPNQDPDKITKMFTDHFNAIAPKSVTVKVTPHHGGPPYVTPTNTIEYQAAEKAYEAGFGKKPIPARAGGSIPIVSIFENVLGVKTVLMGFGLNTDDIHSPNEHYGLFNYYKGIETIPYFYQFYAEMKN